MDDDRPADPVGRIAIQTLPHLRAGDIDVESLGVQGGRHILDPLDPSLNIFNDLIVTGDEEDLSGTEIDRVHAVPDPVDIDQLSLQGNGIGAGQEEIRTHL